MNDNSTADTVRPDHALAVAITIVAAGGSFLYFAAPTLAGRVFQQAASTLGPLGLTGLVMVATAVVASILKVGGDLYYARSTDDELTTPPWERDDT